MCNDVVTSCDPERFGADVPMMYQSMVDLLQEAVDKLFQINERYSEDIRVLTTPHFLKIGEQSIPLVPSRYQCRLVAGFNIYDYVPIKKTVVPRSNAVQVSVEGFKCSSDQALLPIPSFPSEGREYFDGWYLVYNATESGDIEVVAVARQVLMSHLAMRADGLE